MYPVLFGPGNETSECFIFDFCAIVECFDENPAGAVGGLAEPLQKRLFKRRLELMSVLPAVAAAGSAGATADNLGEGRGGYDALVALRGEIADELHGEVAAMNLDNFIVRPQGEHVGRFRERKAWDRSEEHTAEL